MLIILQKFAFTTEVDISEYAVRAYTTPDSAVSYLNQF